ncbi:MAG: long-chain fatty acid--CoA ligase [Alphaproteobacteria bacterium]|nr:long-chain fatty acid--CoA ligase [Alphaproteobacteria bacterium]
MSIDVSTVDSLGALMLAGAQHAPERVAFYVPDGLPFPELPGSRAPGPAGTRGAWHGLTVRQALDNVAGIAAKLRALGVTRGTPVAILAETSHAWVALDLAVLCLGGITVGIYPTLTGPDVAWQLAHSRAELLFVEDEAQYDKVRPHLDDLDDLRHVFAMAEPADPERARVATLAPGKPDLAMLRTQVAAVGRDDVAAIVYTSGTTGEPKGVVLTHGQFLENIASTAACFPVEPGSRSIVFLPLAHSLQRFTVYRGLAEDIEGWFAPDIAALPDVLRDCRPQLLVTVPRMLEKIKATAEAKAAERGPVSATILRWAIAVGHARNLRLREGRRVPRRLDAQYRLAERLVHGKVKEALGGEVTLLCSGGAALSVDVAEWFEALGMGVREGWGLTETCAPATLNTAQDFRIGSVGRPMPGVELAIAADGEVLVRGPGLFQGYLHDLDATSDALLLAEDGGRPWFRTGDLGRIDGDGYLFITGRKKAIIVTAGGKNIAPAPLEKALEGGIVGQACVVGDERPYLVALLALDPEALAARATAAGWPGGPQEWRDRPEVQAAVQAQVDRANAPLPPFSTIKRWALLPGELTVEAGELTPTLKLKRRVVQERHAGLVAGLYTR